MALSDPERAASRPCCSAMVIRLERSCSEPVRRIVIIEATVGAFLEINNFAAVEPAFAAGMSISVGLRKRANCKMIFPNWPTSGEHDFSSLFRDIGGNLIGYGGGIMANLIFKAWGC
ncbi:hypothetical protein, partial [Massilia genomosp. 1]|uniref:hypothetical protein n=1 Tax=Massilia genomosp. 1 TaxID=2609280 RepID=UPI001C9E4F95